MSNGGKFDFSSIGGQQVAPPPIDFSSVGGVSPGTQQLSPADQALARVGIRLSGKGGPGTMPPVPQELQGPPEPQTVTVPGMDGGGMRMEVPSDQTPQQFRQAYQQGSTQGGISGLAGVGAAALPEALAPELGGVGAGGYLANVLTRTGLAGAGAMAGTSTGQTLAGQNPLKPENVRQSVETGAYTGALTAPLEMIGQFPFTKAGRSAVNLSLGAQARDVTYGNPAKGILDEGIKNITTGDFEAYKNALRQGQSPADAAQAAGGRIAAVSQKINQIAPQLNATLRASNAQIPVASAIDQPLHDAVANIIQNPAMTQAEKDAAINQLGELQASIHQQIPAGATYITPAQTQFIKQSIGERVNWGGNVAIGDEVKPAYRALYGSLKNSIHDAVPGAAALDERLTNLMAAHNDLNQLAKLEEVGRGMGVARGKIGSSWLGAIQSGMGRVPVPQMPAAAGPGTKALLGITIQGRKKLFGNE